MLLSGSVTVSQRDGLGHVVPIVRQGPGQCTAEVAQLSGGHALVDGDADADAETLLIAPDQLRTLIIAEADPPEGPRVRPSAADVGELMRRCRPGGPN